MGCSDLGVDADRWRQRPRVGREAAQDELDDAFRETLVDRSAGHEQSVEDGAAEHVERELEIESATEIPAPHTALEDRAQRRAAAGEKLLADGAGQLRVAARLLEEGRHQPRRERAAVQLDGLAHQRQQVGAGRPRIRDRDLADQGRDRVADELILGAVAPVDRGLPDTRTLRDVVHPKITDAALGHQLERRREDRAIRSRVPRPPDRRRRRRVVRHLRLHLFHRGLGGLTEPAGSVRRTVAHFRNPWVSLVSSRPRDLGAAGAGQVEKLATERCNAGASRAQSCGRAAATTTVVARAPRTMHAISR